MHEGIPIFNYLVPKAFTHEQGRLTGVMFEKVSARSTTRTAAASWCPPASPMCTWSATTCWWPSARRTRSPGSSATSASSSTARACRWWTRSPCSRRIPKVFFGGDAAFGPKNIIWAVAHGHDAAISIDKLCHGEDVRQRPAPAVNLLSQKMGIHEWSYDNADLERRALPGADQGEQDHPEGHQGGGRAGLRSQARLRRSAALPQLRRADGVHAQAVHRVRCLRGHLPDGLHQLHRQRRGAGAARTPARARGESVPGPLRLRRAQDRPHHGQGRGPVPALRAVRRALPDRRLGHAEVLPGHADRNAVQHQEAAARVRRQNNTRKLHAAPH